VKSCIESKMQRYLTQGFLMVLAACVLSQAPVHAAPAKKPKTDSTHLRMDYIARLEQQDVKTVTGQTVGSLWSPNSTLSDLSLDYKARKVNDTIVVLVAVQTSAAQSGDSNYSRTFQTSSAITGLAGDVKTKGLNPLFNANSATALKGSGATDSNTTFQTSLTGQVVAVLPSGNLVIEAQRKIFMNNQHEDVTVRGVVRPNDIGPSNTVSSASLSNLEIEMKGKGIISDSTRPLNPITRAILWLVGF
jgi:flagellar L-ring protein precursor FlgH